MSDTTTKKKDRAAPTGVTDVAARLRAIDVDCGFSDPLPAAERRARLIVIHRMPSAILERILGIARRQNGVVAGIAFDADAVERALAEADQADVIAVVAGHLMRRARDHAIRKRAEVRGTASAIKQAMRGFAKTEQGKALRSENDRIRSIAKAARAPRKAVKTKATKAAKGTKGTKGP